MALQRGNVAPAAPVETAAAETPIWEQDNGAAATLTSAEVLEPAAANEPTTAIAPRANTAVAAPAGGGGNFQAELAEAGFEGLSLGYGSFPIIVLKDGEFQCDDLGSLGDSFNVVLMGSKKKLIYKNSAQERSPDKEMFFSYDGQVTTKGEPIPQILAAWQSKGLTYTVSEYLDVTAQLADGAHAGQVVILSIPPASIGRFSGYVAMLKIQRGRAPSEVVTTVHRGPKVTKVQFPFYPWAFKFGGEVA